MSCVSLRWSLAKDNRRLTTRARSRLVRCDVADVTEVVEIVPPAFVQGLKLDYFNERRRRREFRGNQKVSFPEPRVVVDRRRRISRKNRIDFALGCLNGVGDAVVVQFTG